MDVGLCYLRLGRYLIGDSRGLMQSSDGIGLPCGLVATVAAVTFLPGVSLTSLVIVVIVILFRC